MNIGFLQLESAQIILYYYSLVFSFISCTGHSRGVDGWRLSNILLPWEY